MALLVPPRSHDAEIMDRPDNAVADLAAALGDIRTVNRWLGGQRALLGALRPFLIQAGPDEVLELLDLGTGGGDLPLAMDHLARGLGRRLAITAVDLDPGAAAIAARATAGRPRIAVARADAFRLPFPPRSFDLVTASMFLHHFHEDDVVRLLRSLRQVARRAVLINDLRRHRLPWVFIAAAARITRRHPMFVHDAPLSVLRGFTPRELELAAREAGVPGARVGRRWPFRLVLTLPAA